MDGGSDAKIAALEHTVIQVTSYLKHVRVGHDWMGKTAKEAWLEPGNLIPKSQGSK